MTVDGLAQYALSALIAVGIIVLIAMDKITADAGLPLLAALGAVHAGGTVASNASRRTAAELAPLLNRPTEPSGPQSAP